MVPGCRAPVALCAAGLVCLAGAGVAGLHQAGQEPQARVTPLGVSPAPAVTADPAAPEVVHPLGRLPGANPTAPTAARVGMTPVLLTLPGNLGEADVVPVGALSTGDLQIPADPAVVGWWAAGAAPGDPAGTVVMAGHLDSKEYGLGFFARLAQLQIGQTITVTDCAGHRTRYAVSSRSEVAKSALPADLFTAGSPGRLVLITCGGSFSRANHYADNVIITGVPVDHPV